MPYHTGRLTTYGSSMREVFISGSSILDSALDMHGRNITSVKDPVRPMDAANKNYTDTLASQFAESFEAQFSGYYVALKGTEYANVVNMKSGSYVITVSAHDFLGPTAVFSISKGHEAQTAQVTKQSSHPGPDLMTNLEINWPRNGLIRLRKNGFNYDGQYQVNFNMKNVSSVPAPPVQPSDTATKEFVLNKISEQMDVKFGGVYVTLVGTAPQNVANLRYGSHILTVSPINIDGAPTASFSVSKQSMGHDAVTKAITECPGIYTPEILVLSWPAEGMLRLEKTGPGYDGRYLIDLGLKNFSSVPVPEIPTDTATRGYVDMQIERKMQNRFGGQRIQLFEDTFTPLFHMRPGAYVICVSSLVPGGPCSTFSVTKSSNCSEPHIIVTSASPGRDTNVRLELVWPRNSMILLRKTGIFFNGEYVADVPSKNTSLVSEVVIDSDVADKDYVHTAIDRFLNVKYGGIKVELTDTQFSTVAYLHVGSFSVAVSPLQMDGAPTAVFNVSKSRMSLAGNIVKTVGCNDGRDTLELSWPANKPLKLRKTGRHNDGMYLVDFNLKNFTTTPEPVIPTDIATRSFVTEEIDRFLNGKYGGIKVELTGTQFSTVADLELGSFSVAVSPLQMDGAPTAVFNVSKSKMSIAGNVVKTVGCNDGHDTLELSWPANKPLKLRKTGSQYDGTYLVDFNLRNFTTTSEPTDLAT